MPRLDDKRIPRLHTRLCRPPPILTWPLTAQLSKSHKFPEPHSAGFERLTGDPRTHWPSINVTTGHRKTRARHSFALTCPPRERPTASPFGCYEPPHHSASTRPCRSKSATLRCRRLRRPPETPEPRSLTSRGRNSGAYVFLPSLAPGRRTLTAGHARRAPSYRFHRLRVRVEYASKVEQGIGPIPLCCQNFERSLVLRCVKEFAMRAGAEGGQTLKTCR
jgi:hypothetical protein